MLHLIPSAARGLISCTGGTYRWLTELVQSHMASHQPSAPTLAQWLWRSRDKEVTADID